MRLLLLVVVLAFSCLPTFAADSIPAYADLLADCTAKGDAACAGQQTVLAAQWPKVLAGDALSLRNFAFCFADGCFGALKIDPIRACALRIVIVAVNSGPVGDEDRANFGKDCGRLGPEAQQAAKETARDLVRTIRRGAP
jgi:hypothetical protein